MRVKPSILLSLCVFLGALSPLIVQGQASSTKKKTKFVSIPRGVYKPLFTGKNEPKKVKVKRFKMDAFPVRAEEFLDFVTKNPKWRRSNRKSIFADKGYLSKWKSDLELGSAINPSSPVVEVSWFAAKAFCKAKKKRLPTVSQWEYVAAASDTKRYAMEDAAYKEKLIKWYSKPTEQNLPEVGSTYPANIYGVHDMHGVIWEWTLDFNTALVTGESRGDSALNKQLYCGAGSAGASDFKDYTAFMRYAFRSSLRADFSVASLGFRCVK